MKLEDLQNVTVNVNSETAKVIADQYLQFKYMEHISDGVSLVIYFIGAFFLLSRMIKAM